MIVKAITAIYTNKHRRAASVLQTPYGETISHFLRNTNFVDDPRFELDLAFKSLRKACSL